MGEDALDYRGILDGRDQLQLPTTLRVVFHVDVKHAPNNCAQRMRPFPLPAGRWLEKKAEVVTNCGHLAKLKFSKSLPFAFTEHGAMQALTTLSLPP